MSLTGNEITASRTYTVTLDESLSHKRFRDAVALVKGINGRVVGLVYDPASPKAYKTGYCESTDTAASSYDSATRTWTVTIPDGGGYPLADLRALASAYGAEVTDAAQETAAAAPAPRRRPANAEWAEYAGGFGPDELAAMSAATRQAITGHAG